MEASSKPDDLRGIAVRSLKKLIKKLMYQMFSFVSFSDTEYYDYGHGEGPESYESYGKSVPLF